MSPAATILWPAIHFPISGPKDSKAESGCDPHRRPGSASFQVPPGSLAARARSGTQGLKVGAGSQTVWPWLWLTLRRSGTLDRHVAVTEELRMAAPASVGPRLIRFGLRGLKRFDDWDKLVQERMKQFPDELAYVRSASMLAAIVESLASLGNHQGIIGQR